MWRDRTNLFISYRQSYSHNPSSRSRFSSAQAATEERRGLISAYDDEGNGDVVIEMDLLPPRWLDVQDEVSEALAQIAAETRKLDALHSKHVLPGFDDEADKRREEREIERLTQIITRKFQFCQKSIKGIDAMIMDSNQGEEVMARNLKISLATKVGEASTLFRKKQSTYLRKLQALDGMSVRDSSIAIQNPLIDSSMLDSENDRSFSQNTLQQTSQQRMVQHDNEGAIAQREREIEKIAQGVIELANIFQDLQGMIIDQGSMLDRIDYNVEKMGTDVKEAHKELVTAHGYQRRSLKRKIMLLIALLILGVIILIFLKTTARTSDKPRPPTPPVPPTQPDPPTPPDSVDPDDRLTLSRRSITNAIPLRRNWRKRRRPL